MKNKICELYKRTEIALSVVYDFCKEDAQTVKNEYSTDYMTKLSHAFETCILFNNSLQQALKEDLIKLTKKEESMLVQAYSFFDILPREEATVKDLGGENTLNLYKGFIESMTPIMICVDEDLKSKL